jgi:hypothetical protein
MGTVVKILFSPFVLYFRASLKPFYVFLSSFLSARFSKFLLLFCFIPQSLLSFYSFSSVLIIALHLTLSNLREATPQIFIRRKTDKNSAY